MFNKILSAVGSDDLMVQNITKDNHFEGEDLAMYSTFYT